MFPYQVHFQPYVLQVPADVKAQSEMVLPKSQHLPIGTAAQLSLAHSQSQVSSVNAVA